MKKIFIIAAMAVAGITTANAQEFKVGAKAGFLMSNVSVDSSSDIEAGKLITSKLNTAFRPGFHFGAFIEYGFNEKIWVEAGVDYAFQGAKLKSVEATVINISDGSLFASKKANIKNGWLKTQQFNIPLWVKYDISGFRPKVGVNLGFLSKAKTNLEIEGALPEENIIINKSLTPDKKFDFGLGFGAEYNLPMGLFFDATFNLGLTKLSNKEKNDDGTYSEGGKFKNRVFQIGVGYKF
ncbi:porin family protein [Capnocytophaga sputigena]|uniref:porin family protein n=1 Tax=Capnocytophaga sputigena TaxID=1019 RepID=UPI0028D5C96D|nr:porin family protein [Capnocytophaga sputigena]